MLALIFVLVPIVNGFTLNWFGESSAVAGTTPTSTEIDLSEDFALSDRAKANYGEAVKALKVFEGDESECWEEQQEFLVSKCAEVGHKSRNEVAIRLANCQLKMNGLNKLACKDSDSSASCMAKLVDDTRSYTVYTNFFRHIDNICAFMKNDQFRHTTLKSVKQLYDAALDTSENLEKWNVQSQQLYSKIDDNVSNLRKQNEEYLENIEAKQDNILNVQQTMNVIAKDTTKQIEQLREEHIKSFQEVQQITQKVKEDILYVLGKISFDIEIIKELDLTIVRHIFQVPTFCNI
jgi:hypothetical protein